MAFADANARMHDTAIRIMGERVAVNGTDIDAVIERDVEIVGEFGQVVERRTSMAYRSGVIPRPPRGAPVVVAGNTYAIDRVESDDGHVVKVWLR